MYKSLLITGGAGFIGSNFIYYWGGKYPKDNIVVIDSLNYAANLKSIKPLIDNGKVKFIQGNINNYDLIYKSLRKFNITNLINFAAETHVDRSIKYPEIFINSNILGTYNLLNCFKQHWEENNKPSNWRFMQISTDEVFGSLESKSDKFTELTSYKPRSPYSASKAASDHLVEAWHSTFDLPTLITNCSNNYGPYQFPEKLIPLTITNLLMSNQIPLYGDGLNIRDWLFVEDHCSAIDAVITKAKLGQKYCIGANNEIKNIDLITSICKLVDQYAPEFNLKLKHKKSTDLITYVSDRPGHDRRYAINSSKIYDDLGWRSNIKFEQGLKKTIIWYLKNKNWWKDLLTIKS